MMLPLARLRLPGQFLPASGADHFQHVTGLIKGQEMMF
jgi:hypothetical protein